jgi:SAM-dependent methyltransferase
MEEQIYHRMAEVEEHHWWFAGRRAIVAQAIAGLKLPGNAAILEAGCGTGGNFAMLGQFGQVYAQESDSTALHYAVRRGSAEIARGRLPDELPFPGRHFDLIVLLDVLEHIDQDAAALAALAERLAPGGSLLITVPAFRFLWSSHDELHHHVRRYTRAGLAATVERAGLSVDRLTCFNCILLPLVFLVRTISRLRKAPTAAGLEIPPAPVNKLLTALFASERHLLKIGTLPIGVSLLAIARKPADPAVSPGD